MQKVSEYFRCKKTIVVFHDRVSQSLTFQYYTHVHEGIIKQLKLITSYPRAIQSTVLLSAKLQAARHRHISS